MRKVKFLSFIFLITSILTVSGQETVLIRGKIMDKETKDPLPAYISICDTEIGRSAEYDGTFVLHIPQADTAQKIELCAFLIGYKKKIVEAVPGEFLILELQLEPVASHEITVSADSVISETEVQNTVAMDKMDVYKLPGTAADPVFASQVLPGVNSYPDASTMLIRGGSPEEVTFYFDGIEVEHPFLSESLHESYFSIFDNQIVEGFNVSSSGFHPKFGDALSGVMDITAKDRASTKEGGLGLSIMGLNSYVGLPIEGIGSFVGSYNAGHSYLMTRINNRTDSEFKTRNGFAKLNIRINKSNTLRILGLGDNYNFAHESGFHTNSNNLISGVSLTSMLRTNIVSQLLFSRVSYDANFEIPDVFRKQMDDLAYQFRLDNSIDLESHYFEVGADLQIRTVDVSIELPEAAPEIYNSQGSRLGMYFNDRFRIFDKVYADLGVRFLSLSINGHEINIDSRASLAYLLTRDDIVRFSVGQYNQFGSYFTLQDNTDLGPKTATHFSLSYDRITKDMDFRVTLYDKEYRNLFLNVEDGLVNNGGSGFARGGEVFLKLSKQRYDALLVYNYLSSQRKENSVLELTKSPYEINHSLTLIFTWMFHNTSLGLRYSLATGLPFTPLLGREWDIQSQMYGPVWGKPFSKKYPNYRRIDLNGSHSFTLNRKMIILYFGLTNLLNDKNILRYEYNEDYSVRNNQFSIFGRSIFIGVYLPIF